MNKIRRSFALCASVATTFMHASAEKIYKSHILRTATITRTSSTRSLTVHVGHKTSTQNLSKKRLWSGARSLRSVQDPVGWPCGITNISQDLSVQDLCPIACVTQKRSGGHEVMSVLHLPCKIDVHVPCLPHWITHLRCATPGETAITSSRPNQPMPRKTRTFLLWECTIHAKPRSWTTLTAATPPAPAYTSRIPLTATTLFGELFCWKIPEKDVTKADRRWCEMGLTMEVR